MKKLLLSLLCLTVIGGASASLISCTMRTSEVEVLFKDKLESKNFSLAQTKNPAINTLNQLFQLFVYTGKGKQSLRDFMGQQAIDENSFLKRSDSTSANDFMELVSKPNKYTFKLNLNIDGNNFKEVNIGNFKPIELKRVKEGPKDPLEIDLNSVKLSEKNVQELAKEDNELAKKLIEQYKEQHFLSELLDIDVNEIKFSEKPIEVISSEKYFAEISEQIYNLEDDEDNKVAKENLIKKRDGFQEKIDKEDNDDLKSLNYQKFADELNKDLKKSNLYKIKPLEKEMKSIARISLFTDKDGKEYQAGIDDMYYAKTKAVKIEVQVFDKSESIDSITVEVPQLYLVFKPSFLREKNNSKSTEEKNLVFLQAQNYQFTEYILSKNIFKGLKTNIL